MAAGYTSANHAARCSSVNPAHTCVTAALALLVLSRCTEDAHAAHRARRHGMRVAKHSAALGPHRWRQREVKGMPEKSPSSSTFQLPSIPDPLARLFSASGPCADKSRNHRCGNHRFC